MRNVCVGPSWFRCKLLRWNSTASYDTLQAASHGHVNDTLGIIYRLESESTGIGSLWTAILSRFSTIGRGGAFFTLFASPRLSCHGIVTTAAPDTPRSLPWRHALQQSFPIPEGSGCLQRRPFQAAVLTDWRCPSCPAHGA